MKFVQVFLIVLQICKKVGSATGLGGYGQLQLK
jgi:hypothetical protein